MNAIFVPYKPTVTGAGICSYGHEIYNNSVNIVNHKVHFQHRFPLKDCTQSMKSEVPEESHVVSLYMTIDTMNDPTTTCSLNELWRSNSVV